MDQLSAALAYAAHGLYVFPARVKRVAGGKKQSRFPPSWKEASTTNAATIASWWGPGEQWEGAHICIDCGRSGLVVVDADGQEGLDSLAALGLDGTTPVVATTPTGGRHLYYRERPGVVIGNSARKLAPGLDVRGLGGLVFAPPSADTAGPYRWGPDAVTDFANLPVVPDVVVNLSRRAREEVTGAVTGVTDSPVTPVTHPSPAGQDVFETAERAFTHAEAARFCRPFMDALSAAQDGEINSRLNDAAKALSHFGPDFWPRADAERWLAARLAATVYDGATWQARDTIDSAYASAGQDWRAVRLPDQPDPTAPPPPPEPDQVDAFLAELLDAKALVELPPPAPLIRGWLDMDSLAYLIGKAGSRKSFVALDWAAHVGRGLPWMGQPVRQGEVWYLVAEGVTGMGKRVRAWQEHEPPDEITGPRGEMTGVRFLPRPVQASGQEWDVLVAAAARVRPALVVLDTQARVTVGLEENSNTDMGKFVHQADRLRQATGGCVLVVHHLGRSGDDARGASALDGAQTTEIRVEKCADGPNGELVGKLHQDKQKDQAEAEPLGVRFHVVGLGRGPDGEDLDSLVLHTSPFDTDTPALVPPPDYLTHAGDNREDVLEVLFKLGGDNGLTNPELRRLINADRERRGIKPISEESVRSALMGKDKTGTTKGLVAEEKVLRRGQRYVDARNLESD